MNTQTIKRKRGEVVRLDVEIDASQAKILNKIIAQLGMTKADAIAQALNIWFSMVSPKADK